jgi:hypothetical protein
MPLLPSLFEKNARQQMACYLGSENNSIVALPNDEGPNELLWLPLTVSWSLFIIF